MKKDERIQLNFKLDRGTSEQIRGWMAMQGFMPGAESDAVRAIIASALASTPKDGLMSNARSLAYRKIHTWMTRRSIAFLGEIRAELHQMLIDDGEEIIE